MSNIDRLYGLLLALRAARIKELVERSREGDRRAKIAEYLRRTRRFQR